MLNFRLSAVELKLREMNMQSELKQAYLAGLQDGGEIANFVASWLLGQDQTNAKRQIRDSLEVKRKAVEKGEEPWNKNPEPSQN